MSNKISTPNAKLLLLNAASLGGKDASDLGALRHRLSEIMPDDPFDLAPVGNTMAELTIAAKNVWQRDRVKHLVESSVEGWSVIERQSYTLPKAL